MRIMQLIVKDQNEEANNGKTKRKKETYKQERNNYTGIEVFCKQWNKLPFAQISMTTANLVSRVAP